MSNLEKFGLAVLEILAAEDEWSSDELEYIAEAAKNLGLADANADGLFARTEDC